MTTPVRALVPPLPAQAFERERLLDLLASAVQRKVTTVVAPAGYGKSVAVSQWCGRSDRPVAWLDLREGDDDGVRFARSLMGALSAALGDSAPRLDLVDVGGRSLGVDLIDRLIADLALVGDVVVVFDNFEVVRSPDLVADLATLVDRAPGSTHFVIVSRSDPGIGTSTLRLRGELTELRRDSLAMDVDEAAALLARTAAVELDARSLELLVHRTSGWPAALQLAALSLRDADDPAASVERFSGNDRHVAEYLTDEVLRACSADERTFLIETSTLDRVNGALCDHVTGGSGGQAMLRALERRGMLLARLDGPGEWYRYHPLLAGLLRTELEVGDPDRHRELMLRAAEWHEQNGDIEAASACLVEARAWDQLLELTRVHGRACFERGLTTMLRTRADAIPERLRFESPIAGLTCATLHLLCGQSHLADDELVRLQADTELSPWEDAVAEAARSAMVAWHLDPERAIQAGERALTLIDTIGDDAEPVDVLGITSLRSLEVIALVAVGRALHYLGHNDAARDVLERATVRSEGAYLPWYLHSLGVRSTLEALDGDLPAATALATQVVDVAARSGLESHPATAEAQLAIAIVRREQDSLAEAAYALDRALGLIRSNHRRPLALLHAAESALLQSANGDHRAALDLFAAGLADAETTPQPYARHLVAAGARCLLSAGDPAGAAALLGEHVGTDGDEGLALASLATAVACRDLGRARQLVGELASVTAPRSVIERELWSAVIAERDHDRPAAMRHFAAAAELASAHGLRRVFLDSTPEVMALARAHHERMPTSFVRSLVERATTATPRGSSAPELIEQLTDREMAVLLYLPTRLSNSEIAARLFVSVNTVKTHLKHIYRKLEVESRTAAIERADDLGLLR